MGPVWQNPIQRTVRTAHLNVLITVHSFSTQYTQNSSDNLTSYFQSTIIVQMLSTGEQGCTEVTKFYKQSTCWPTLYNNTIINLISNKTDYLGLSKRTCKIMKILALTACTKICSSICGELNAYNGQNVMQSKTSVCQQQTT